MKRIGMCAAWVSLVIASSVQAQPPGVRGASEAPSPFLFYHVLHLGSSEPGKARVDVHYRVADDFFVPVKNNDPAAPLPFLRRGEILVELFDSLGISKTREISRLEAGARTSERNGNTRTWRQGIASFTVNPGTYSVVLEVTDLESERKVLERDRTVKATGFSVDSLAVGTPFFVLDEGNFAAGSRIIPVNFGGDLEFGRKAALVIPIQARPMEEIPVQVRYAIAERAERSEKPAPVISDSSAGVITLRGVNLLPRAEGDAIRYELTREPERPGALLIVPLESERLPLRRLELDLTIRGGASEKTIRHPFRMVWPEMPVSLRNVDYALDALRLLVSETEMDSLRRRTQKESKVAVLEQFWKEKDRTPATALNEVMAEYYRRVDHAVKAFGTLRDPDGLKTDRGRIYVIFGPPTRVERALNPSAPPEEIWVYESHRKRFVFADRNRSGNYTLVATQNL